MSAPSTVGVRRESLRLHLHGHWYGGTVVLGGGRKGVWGKPGTGAVVFRGRGRFRVPPSATPICLTPSVCAEWSCSDPDLTLGAPRGGGEVGITEAQRSDPVRAGKRAYQPRQRGTVPVRASATLCGRYMVVVRDVVSGPDLACPKWIRGGEQDRLAGECRWP
jgi:hypothetical protein